MSSKIYLDNNATTKLDPRVLEVMVEELQADPSNPSSIHSFGRSAHARLVKARESIASYFAVDPKELIFTASGTEALNLAILGANPKGEIISSKIEHPAVYNTLKRLQMPIIYLPIDQRGHVQVEDLISSITPQTSLIVLSAVNSETGVKNPIAEIAEVAKSRSIPFLVDGVALLGKEIFTIPDGVTAMAFSGHKIHGPKGSGLLFARKKWPITPLLTGGGQELLKRAGTENLAGILGLAKAIELLEEEPSTAIEEMKRLRNLLEQGLPNAKVNGTGPRVCNTSSLTFPNVDGEALLIHLDQLGIAASMGSACTSGSVEPPRTLLEMGLRKNQALSTLRFSLSRLITEEEIQRTIQGILSLSSPICS